MYEFEAECRSFIRALLECVRERRQVTRLPAAYSTFYAYAQEPMAQSSALELMRMQGVWL